MTAPAADLRFAKYSLCGNTFLVVDEDETPLADDRQRGAVARWMLDGEFGIGGADNVLYVGTDIGTSGVAFRIFEHDGAQTLSCGNGLLCVALLLHRTRAARSWDILTELPSGCPQRVRAGIDEKTGRAWADIGPPRPAPPELFTRQDSDRVDLVVPLPRDQAWSEGLPEAVVLSGVVVFTGEPHLVLTGGAELAPGIVDRLFAPPVPADGTACPASDRLLEHLGSYVNTAYRDLFPLGVHLDVGRIRLPSGAIEYRTYERAIDRETLACGSGAAAIAHVAQRILGLLPPGAVTLWPHRCRRRQADAYLTVTPSATGLVLSGAPRFVCGGSFSVSSASHNSNIEEAAACQIPISA